MKQFALFFVTVGVLLITTSAFGEKQSITFSSKDLNVAGDFPFNSHPLIISGFDNLEKAYKLEVQTQKQPGNTYKVTYSLYRGEKLDKTASIITQKNHPGEISQKMEGQTEAATAFKFTITD